MGLLQMAKGFEGEGIVSPQVVHYLIRVEIVLLGTILVALLLNLRGRI